MCELIVFACIPVGFFLAMGIQLLCEHVSDRRKGIK